MEDYSKYTLESDIRRIVHDLVTPLVNT